jgi:peptide/nickel transport system permease protein
MSARRTRSSAFRALLHSPIGLLAFTITLAILSLAFLAPILWTHGATTLNFNIAGDGPIPGHPLGTDGLGRDLLDRVLVATRLSLELAALATAIAAGGGVAIGCLVPLLPRRIGTFVARANDAMLGFPDILLAIFLVTILGAGAGLAALAVGVANIPFFARVVTALAASIGGRDYVASARVLGVRTPRLVSRYFLPNMSETLVSTIFTQTAYSLIAVSSLSFLGLGVQPPQFDWGLLVNQGLQQFYETPYAVLGPAIMIAVTGLTLGLLGDALAHALNPRMWTAETALRRVRPFRRKAFLAQLTRGPVRRSQQPRHHQMPERGKLFEIRNLSVRFTNAAGDTAEAVRGVDLTMESAEILGIVGESGSGKTLTTLALGDLVPHPGRISADLLAIGGCDVRELAVAARQDHLARSMAFVFQDASSALNPALRIGTQLTEVARHHRASSRSEARHAAVEMLDAVHVSAPERRLRQYPHELSGGMRQRVLVAMALMARTALLVADEPTTALDVTAQAQVLDLIREINSEFGTGVIFISHNIAVVAELCSRVAVMYAGRIVEDGPVDEVIHRPAHPYTRMLLASTPALAADENGSNGHLTDIPGAPPELWSMPEGCPFAPRCPLRLDKCRDTPTLTTDGVRSVACWRADRHDPAQVAP